MEACRLEESYKKCELGEIKEQISLSVEIGYNLDMDSFKEEANKKGLMEYFYQILNILITL